MSYPLTGFGQAKSLSQQNPHSRTRSRRKRLSLTSSGVTSDPIQHRIVRVPPNKLLQRTTNSEFQLTTGGIWRHTGSSGSGPVSAIVGR